MKVSEVLETIGRIDSLNDRFNMDLLNGSDFEEFIDLITEYKIELLKKDVK